MIKWKQNSTVINTECPCSTLNPSNLKSRAYHINNSFSFGKQDATLAAQIFKEGVAF